MKNPKKIHGDNLLETKKFERKIWTAEFDEVTWRSRDINRS